MIIHDLEQGSPEWIEKRKGRPTASEFSRILTPARGGLAAGRHAYMEELVSQCFHPDFESFRGTADTERGQKLESEARDEFTRRTGRPAETVGFITRDDGVVGCSPDAMLVDGNGEFVAGLELKCPQPKTHVRYVVSGGLPDEYKCQVHGSMAVTGLREWYFMSYCPGMNPLIIRVEWSVFTSTLSDALDLFLDEYKEFYAKATQALQLEESA